MSSLFLSKTHRTLLFSFCIYALPVHNVVYRREVLVTFASRKSRDRFLLLSSSLRLASFHAISTKRRESRKIIDIERYISHKFSLSTFPKTDLSHSSKYNVTENWYKEKCPHSYFIVSFFFLPQPLSVECLINNFASYEPRKVSPSNFAVVFK